MPADNRGFAVAATWDSQHPDLGQWVNFIRYCFLARRAHDVYPDWEGLADSAVNLLRTDADRDPYDRGISNLVGELSTRNEQSRVRRAKYDVCRELPGAPGRRALCGP